MCFSQFGRLSLLSHPDRTASRNEKGPANLSPDTTALRWPWLAGWRRSWPGDIFGLEALHTERETERKTKDKAI